MNASFIQQGTAMPGIVPSASACLQAEQSLLPKLDALPKSITSCSWRTCTSRTQQKTLSLLYAPAQGFLQQHSQQWLWIYLTNLGLNLIMLHSSGARSPAQGCTGHAPGHQRARSEAQWALLFFRVVCFGGFNPHHWESIRPSYMCTCL